MQSEEAKARASGPSPATRLTSPDARAELKKMGVEVDSADSGSSEPTKTHAEEVHDHRVIGGLKAATHNPVRATGTMHDPLTPRRTSPRRPRTRPARVRPRHARDRPLICTELEAMGETAE